MHPDLLKHKMEEAARQIGQVSIEALHLKSGTIRGVSQGPPASSQSRGNPGLKATNPLSVEKDPSNTKSLVHRCGSENQVGYNSAHFAGNDALNRRFKFDEK